MSKSGKNSMFGKKRSKLSVLPVIFSSVLAAGAATGVGVSVWHVSKNYQESSEFTKSFNARINVDPVAFELDANKYDKNKAIANLKESAKRLSAWLKYNGSSSYDVSYELTEPTTIGAPYTDCGWLSAHYNVGKVAKKIKTKDDEEKIFNDPYLSYFANGGFNTNNKTLVYRWMDTNHEAKNEPRYTILDFNDIFSIPTDLKSKDNQTKTLIDKDGKSGILIKINKATQLNEIYKDLREAKEDVAKKETERQLKHDWQKPRLYIINNLEQMFNEVNYHLMNFAAYEQEQSVPGFADYRDIYEGTEYQKFATTIRTKDIWGDARSSSEPIVKLPDAKRRAGEEGGDIKNGAALSYLDLSKYGNIESSFLGKYVEKIYKCENKDYEKFFPDKITDTYTNGKPSDPGAEVNLQYAWYPTTSTTVADSYLDKLVNYGLKVKVTNIQLSSTTTIETDLTEFRSSFTSRSVPPKFIDTIFGGNNVIGVLTLGFLLYLIALGIILGLLYRTTGVMSWICMMFMLSMTGLIALIGSKIISMSFLFGMFSLSLVGFFAALAICKRISRRILSNEDTSVAVIKGLKQSLWPLVDISFITLLFGICFTYIAPITLNALGITFIIGGFATFISMYLLNGLMILLFFNNGLTMNKFRFLGRPSNKANDALAQSNSYVPATLDATKLEFAFYDRMSTKKFSIINIKTLVTVSIFGALLIAGIIVFSIQGLANNSLFHSSMCIVITSDTSPIAILQSECHFTWSYYQHIDNLWYFYCDVPTSAVIEKIATNFPTAQFGNIVGTTNKDILNFAILSIVITTLCASVYTCLRSNWTAIVPMIAGSMVVPIIMIGVASMAQIKFDENVILGFALACVFNTILCNTMLASINDAWFRKESYNKEELKFIVTASFKNNFSYILLCALGYGLFNVMFGVAGPLGLNSLTWMIGISGLVSLIISPILVTYLLYWFLIIRAKALTKRAERKANKVVVNMDEIDEQAIEGINKFTKIKAYAKKQTGENK